MSQILQNLAVSLVFRNGEWQMPIDEEDMDYTQFKLKGPPALYQVTIPLSLLQMQNIFSI